ncbi:MAG: hypothetical protein KME50_03680 [Nostoc desertorum CM1-VF14]|nr:hypothetical protein [Nostoc desertorum CM1-VF14]
MSRSISAVAVTIIWVVSASVPELVLTDKFTVGFPLAIASRYRIFTNHYKNFTAKMYFTALAIAISPSKIKL